MRFGYTLMTEQSGPRQLVDYAVAAEGAGFDFEVSSDHYSPWLMSQGHAPYAWTVLGAVAQATSRVELATYVTCPIIRYHPAPVAQRQDMLVEAATIIRELFSGELVTWEGDYFRVDSARLWDAPDGGVPIGIAVSGEKSVSRFAPLADHLIAVEPDEQVIKAWDEQKGGRSSRKIGQIPICWDPDEKRAIKRAHEQFRWFGSGWAVNADLRTPAGFEGASQFVRPEDVAEQIPCGPDLDKIVEAAQPFQKAGFTDLAFVQVGDEGQSAFLEQAAKRLLDKLRADAG